MKAEEKYKIGMFKNVHPDVIKFIHENSNTVCPLGKYDNTIVCSQMDLIRFVNPTLSQLEKAQLIIKELESDDLPTVDVKPRSSTTYKIKVISKTKEQ